MGAGLEREGHDSHVSSPLPNRRRADLISTVPLTDLKITPLSTLDTPTSSAPVLDTLLDNRTSSLLEPEPA